MSAKKLRQRLKSVAYFQEKLKRAAWNLNNHLYEVDNKGFDHSHSEALNNAVDSVKAATVALVKDRLTKLTFEEYAR